MKIQISLEEDNFLIFSSEKLPSKIDFQLEYYNLKKNVSENKVNYYGNKKDLKLEKIIRYLEKNKINISLDQNSKNFLSKLEQERENFNKKTNLIAEIKKRPKAQDIDKFKKNINFLKRDLVSHQITSLFHLYNAESAANFSVPGSGKTSVILAYFEKLRIENKVDAIFVIGPKNSFGSWETEFYENFNIDPKLKILGPNPDDRKIFYEKVLTSNLILSHFSTFTKDLELTSFFKRNKILLVVDEAHYIKKIDGIWSNAILYLSKFVNFKVVLTGTPIPNDLRDVYNYLDFLYGQNKILSPEDKSRIEILLEKERNQEAIELLRDRIDPYFIRITKNDLNLSDQIFNTPTLIEMNPIEKQIYDAIVTKIKDYGRKAFLDNADLIEQICKARIIRLKQCASYVRNLDSVLDENITSYREDLLSGNISQLIAKYDQLEKPAKLDTLLNKVKKLKSENKKVLIWSTHLKTIDLIYEELLVNNINVEKIIGETDLDDRKHIKIQFNDKNSNLDAIVATPQSCSESISLHKACTNAIYYDLSYNAAEFLQSLDRIHRVGGSEFKSVEYDFLQYRQTVDMKV